MTIGMSEQAAIIYLFTHPLTELVSTACCISEDVSLSLSANFEHKQMVSLRHRRMRVGNSRCTTCIFRHTCIHTYVYVCV